MKNRWLDLAHKLSHDSCHVKHQMAAVIVSGGNVISLATNHHGSTKHAEARCLARLKHSDCRGATIYVMRWNGRISKPCRSCFNAIKQSGISKMVFIDEAGNVVAKRVKDEVEENYKFMTHW